MPSNTETHNRNMSDSSIYEGYQGNQETLTTARTITIGTIQLDIPDNVNDNSMTNVPVTLPVRIPIKDPESNKGVVELDANGDPIKEYKEYISR